GSEAEDVEAVAEGALLGNYAYARPGTSAEKDKAPVQRIDVAAALRGRAAKTALARAQASAEAVHAVRDLVNTSPNLLYPESFAAKAADAVKGTKVSIMVLDEQQLRTGGTGG